MKGLRRIILCFFIVLNLSCSENLEMKYQCEKDEDCKAGYRCDKEKGCVKIDNSNRVCTTSLECNSDEDCIGGLCVKKEQEDVGTDIYLYDSIEDSLNTDIFIEDASSDDIYDLQGGDLNNSDYIAIDANDNKAPDTIITVKPANPTNSDIARFEFICNEAQCTFDCKLDNSNWDSCTSPKTYTGLSGGSHTFEVRAKDMAGNVDPTPALYAWFIDTMPPETVLGAKPSDPSYSSSATFEFYSNEPDCTYECRLDNSNWDICTSPKTYTGLSEGSHTFEVRAKDIAGNVDPTPASWTWKIILLHSISGNVKDSKGAGLGGVKMTLSGASYDEKTTDLDGNYSFSNVKSGSYTITPSKAGYIFSPSNRSVSVNNADIVGVDFVGEARILVLVQNSSVLDEDERKVVNFLGQNGYQYQIADPSMIQNGFTDVSSFKVIYFRTGSEPSGYNNDIVRLRIRNAIGLGSSLIVERYGIYLVQYIGWGSIETFTWDPGIEEKTYFVKAKSVHEIFNGIPLWDPPAKPDKEEQTIWEVKPGVYNCIKLILNGAQTIELWRLHTTYGWDGQNTNTEYCNNWGGCTGDRTVETANIYYANYNSGKVIYPTCVGVSSVLCNAQYTLGQAGTSLLKNIISWASK